MPAVDVSASGNMIDESGESSRDVRPLENIFADRLPIKKMIEHEIGGEVGKGVSEGEETEHAAQFDQIVPAGESSRRCDGQSSDQKNQGPRAGEASNEIDRIDAEITDIGVACELRKWNEAEKKNKRF